MDIIIKIIQFFLCFTILVGIHELGHFLMARVFRIRVDKFYIFFDPWFSIFKFKRGDTEYGLGWLPLGGYCKIAGMIDESMDKEQMKLPPKPDEFRTKPAWQRFLVMIAGVVMNVLLAIVIYCGVCYTWGDNYFSNEDAKWGYNFNEAGHKLGFEDGDKFVTIDGEPVGDINKILNSLLITEGERKVVVERGGKHVELTLPLDELIEMRQAKGYEDLFTLRVPFLIDSAVYESAAALRRGDEIVAIDDARGLEYSGYQQYLKTRAGGEVTLTVKREGDMLLQIAVPVSDEGKLGVIARNPYTLRTQEYTFWQSIPAGIEKAGKVISSYWEQLKMIVQPKTKMYEELGGFIAIGSIFPGDWNWEDFWLKTAFLSIILGDEHPAHTGPGRRACDLHVLGDGHGTQGERQGAGRRAVRRAGHHPVPVAVRQRKRHIQVLYQVGICCWGMYRTWYNGSRPTAANGSPAARKRRCSTCWAGTGPVIRRVGKNSRPKRSNASKPRSGKRPAGNGAENGSSDGSW